MSSILILTASFGEGHNAAARNLREAIAARSPDTPVTICDIYRDTYGWFNELTKQTYLRLINHAPQVWKLAFDLLDRTPLVEWQTKLHGIAARKLARIIEESGATTVVSTFPGCNHLLDHAYRHRLKRPFRLVTIITDSISINSVWHRSCSEWFIVGNQPTADVLVRAGVPEYKIRIDGFPVPRVFSELHRSKTPPGRGEKWRILYVVNSGHHLAPGIVRSILGIENIDLTVTVGRHPTLQQELEKVSLDLNTPISVLGWTPEMPRLMAESHLIISKAGGATVQETLAAGTPMIITQVIPGQEEGNATLVIEAGAGAFADTPQTIARTIREAIASNGAQWINWRDQVLRLSRPDAADRIADFVLELNGSPSRDLQPQAD
ncbi:processive 1,2-diacylglycerol beta-glucosyltransferase [Terrimicrobium sacchariphilum]|uniref:Processive 1,2-diacylglycerol beta-glucosyltransferase n=1 Tax=Terrimicrobium sacchariphilum TaxID=690879 RepID=A0A146G0V9_TERSA|nr:glycosyltransferase [Terrimicrobium sacchariphilum]GAT31515.1 processive 1,2-diacylglycerol beta-glucosyltransferase [Terrimicrobium sacchariphilum]